MLGIVMMLLLLAFSTPEQKTQRPVYFGVDADGFSATGEWIPSGAKEKPGLPSETQIDCFKKNMSCVEATAEYYYGHPHVSIAYLGVLKWSDDGIIASSSAGACMTNTVLVSFAEKRFPKRTR